MSGRVRVVVCDDHVVVREGLKAVLDDADFTVVGEAANGQALLEVVSRTHPDVVLLDIQMPLMGGIEAARRILAEHPRVRLLALTTFADEKTIMDCLKTGVHGYVIKDVEKLDLKKHIRSVLRGEAVIDPKVAGVLMARVRGNQQAAAERSEDLLTAQQMTILRYVAQGYSNREIGEKMGLSENTIKGHVAEILHRLNVKNRVEASILASAKGWL